MNINICMNDRRYSNILQNNISNRASSQIAFKGTINPLQNRNPIVSNNCNKIAQKMKFFFIKTFCKPTIHTLLGMGSDINKMFCVINSDVDNKALKKISQMLDVHSKNKKYSDFVKEGIEFLKEAKKIEKESSRPRKLYIETGNVGAISASGHDLIVAIQSALLKAVKPKEKINDHRLQNCIKWSRQFIARF